MLRFLGVFCMLLAGCGAEVSQKPAAQVDVTGTITHAGKPLQGVSITLQPTGGSAVPNGFTPTDGKFTCKIRPGMYSYFAAGPANPKDPAAFKALPDSLKESSLTRQFEVTPQTTSLDLKLD